MYELEKYDDQPSSASLGERLAGIIKRELHIDASAKDPPAGCPTRRHPS